MAIENLTGTTWYVPSGWECLPAPLYNSGYVSDSAFVVYDLDNNIICDYSTNYAPDGYDPHYYGNIGLGKSGTVTESNSTANSILFFDNQTLDSVTINNSKGFVVSFVAASSFSEEFVSFLTTYGTQLKVTDLTNTTWTVNVGWEAEAGYGEFNVTGRLISQQWNFTAISIGEDDGDYIDNHLCFTPYMAIGNGEVANMSITGGTDIKNPALIAWLSKYGELQVEEEGEAPPDDLTGYTVTVPANWSFLTYSTSTITFNINGSVTSVDGSPGDASFSSFIVDGDDDINCRFLPPYIILTTSMSFSFRVNGGSDVSNSSLIQWLVDNKATFTKEGEEETPDTPEEPTVTSQGEIYYKGELVATLVEGETIVLHTKDFKFLGDIVIKNVGEEEEAQEYEVTITFKNSKDISSCYLIAIYSDKDEGEYINQIGSIDDANGSMTVTTATGRIYMYMEGDMLYDDGSFTLTTSDNIIIDRAPDLGGNDAYAEFIVNGNGTITFDGLYWDW